MRATRKLLPRRELFARIGLFAQKEVKRQGFVFALPWATLLCRGQRRASGRRYRWRMSREINILLSKVCYNGNVALKNICCKMRVNVTCTRINKDNVLRLTGKNGKTLQTIILILEFHINVKKPSFIKIKE